MDPSRPAGRVLIADDQPDVIAALRLLLKREGFVVVSASSPAEAIAAVQGQDFDVALFDLNYARDTTSGREGMDLITRVRALDPLLPVVVITAWGSVEGAVEALQRGARDYVLKPWDNARLVATLRTQVELSEALRRGRRGEESARLAQQHVPALVGESPAMAAVIRLLERVAPSDANVLILGEHGTGKEVVARWIHAASSRAARPLVAINAGGLSDGVFDSEMFGHVRGAFTDAKQDRIGGFELADGGTLFLDEIANTPLPQQAKLLRVLQSGEFQRVGSSKLRRTDARILSATNVDIEQEVSAGRFREDLLYRLNTVEVRLPPLRERREDIPVLADHFVRRFAAKLGKETRGLTAEALSAMLEHAWPGNVRELEHVIERAVLLAEGERVEAADLMLRPRARGGARLEDMTLEEVEQHLIQRTIERTGGNVNEAARSLGLSRSALYRRLQQLGIKGGR
ncbi:MAG: sigma-54-dependent Fis family transcriptional regulator [Polyangiaceae bacterium]|nr:sigma-54-dependent Fis family transcriptional regulator [Polyangiaceae bacterium]